MKNEDVSSLKIDARSMKLVYTADREPGYTRQKRGKKFVYYDKEGKQIRDKEDLKRIKSLVLPPAWTNVWICPKANGHLQATGMDKAGRKQYKYHQQWSILRNERKHNRIRDFADALPVIRQQIEIDLRQKEFSKEKVIAMAVSVLDKTFIRVGNSEYTKLYGSFGLTSLRNRHLKISGNKMLISFKGKKGVQQEISLTHTRLARLLKKLQDIPGQELFQFYDVEGNKKSIDAGSVNEYIEKCTGKEFTAKDFRTWWGTVTAAKYLADEKTSSSQKSIPAMLDFVAKKLGNTRAVCKKYYVHPQLLQYYEDDKLGTYLAQLRTIKHRNEKSTYSSPEEQIIVKFLKKECT
jgi:DNA topoisomerase-1